MKKIVLPVLLAILGFVGGAGAGWWMKPPAEEPQRCVGPEGEELVGEICDEILADEEEDADPGASAGAEDSEFMTLDRQFIVPVVSEDRVASMMVLTLSIEVAPGAVEDVFQQEPKLRDALLRALFEHAYTGGFGGDFTNERVMRELRRNLLIAARSVMGEDARDVLVADIIKQAQ